MTLVIIGAFAALFGICAVIFGLIVYYASLKQLKGCTAHTVGAYVKHDKYYQTGTASNKASDKQVSYAPVVRYEVDGEVYESFSAYSEGINMGTSVGSPVIVNFDPDNPSRCWAQVEGPQPPQKARRYFIVAIVGIPVAIIGFVCLAIGLVFI